MIKPNSYESKKVYLKMKSNFTLSFNSIVSTSTTCVAVSTLAVLINNLLDLGIGITFSDDLVNNIETRDIDLTIITWAHPLQLKTVNIVVSRGYIAPSNTQQSVLGVSFHIQPFFPFLPQINFEQPAVNDSLALPCTLLSHCNHEDNSNITDGPLHLILLFF